MFFTRRKPDDVAGPEFFHRSAPALRVAAAGGDDGSGCARGGTGLERRVNPHRAGEPVGGADGGGLGTGAFDVPVLNFFD